MKGAIYPHVFFRKKSLQTPENCNMGGYHFTLLLFTSLVIFFFPTISISIDTLTSTNSVSNNQTLVSAGDVFELGFFNSGGSNSWYVGIWYKNIPTRTYVWIANRDSPLSNSSGVFKVVDQNIVLLDQNQNQVWSSNITKGNNSVAELLDSGNLVLRDAEDPNNYLWQSFDFPTDTLLPDMKLGWNLTSGLDRYLTSWRSLEDPSSGDFSFKLNYQGFPEIFMWIKQQIRYRSGPWNGQRFSGVPEMAPVDDLVFKFIADQDEVYYSFSVTNNILFYRLVLQSGGILARLTWIDEAKQWSQFWYAPEDQCDYYGKCGPYGVCDANESPVCQCPRGFTPKNLQAWNLRDGTNGCVRKTDLGCMSDKFLHLKNVKLPQSTTAFVDRSMSLDACENMCLRNCSCTAYANADISNGGSGCVIWFGELLDMRVYSSGGQDLFVRLNAADLGDSARRNALIIGITVGFAVLILGGIAFFIWKRKRLQRKGKLPELKGLPERSQEFLLNEMVISNRRSEYYGEKSGELELPLFDFDTIAIATDNFSIENKLGQGGFGCVYKGRLVEGRDIAVKRLSKNSGQGVEEFKNEVRLIARVQHRNLVRLLGCCVDMDEKMLIYEYMEHKSLDSILFNKNRSSLLNWQRRFNIICGIARGLLYLHYDSRFRIIHRDLKASNILLDAQMNPKISDFGMARIFGNDQNEANTKRVVGTYGYMSPEYAMDGLFSTKSDVFSFGVLVLEVVSGSKNRGFYQANSEQNLLGHAWRLWKEGKALELLDPVVGNSYPEQEVVRCIHVGLLCVQERAEDRPTMHSVILMLSSETAVMPRPKTPGFGLLERNDVEADSLSSKQDETFTVNQVTVTMLDAR